MSDLPTLKAMLTDRAVSVCQHLHPDGKVIGPEYVVDPGVGKIKVAIRGAKLGVWSHFGGSDDGGDLIDLWRHAKGQTVVEALDDIRLYLGVQRPQFQSQPKREWTRPAKPKCAAPTAAAMDYLTEIRNIPAEILDRYKIGEMGNLIVFPFLRDGELVMAKTREAIDGAKPKPTEAGCEKILFGWQAVDDNAREILITEGEIDALSMAAYTAIPALSVPYGGGGGAKQDWIESEYDRLQRFERIYLCLDNDEEGQKATEEIARRLGHFRCLVITLPRKDANECLVDGVPAADILRCIEGARSLDPEGLHRPLDYLDAVKNLFYPKPGERTGYTLPFEDIGAKLCFRPCEVTVWSGETGSGKSLVLSYATVSWIEQGSMVCMASFEMEPAQTLRRMTKQASNTDRPTEEMIDKTMGWLSGGMLLYDLMGKSKLKPLLEVFEYARARYGCDQFIIDSLMRLGIAADDYVGQDNAINEIVGWAVARRVHVHLVAHTRKSGQDRRMPTADDVKGAMEIVANAANIVLVWRNRAREQAEKQGEPDDEKAKEKYKEQMAKAGVILNCVKQRNGDWESIARLWFNRETYQYRGPLDHRFGKTFVRLHDAPDLIEAAM